MVNGEVKASEEVLTVSEASAGYQLAYVHSLAVPPGYKQTEVGVIPEDWSVREIGDLTPFVTSGSRGWANYYTAYGSAFIRITNLSRHSIYLDLCNLKHVILPPNDKEGTRTELQDGDLLISITADIGIIGYVDLSVPKPAYINQHIALVRFDSDLVDSRFLSYFLAGENSQRLFRASTDQGAKAGMNLTGVRSIKAIFPHLTEQRAIAAALSDVDALLAKLDRLIAKKRDLKQATMQQLLTGQTRLPGFSGEWDKAQLKSFIRSHNSGIYKKSEKYGQGCNIIGVSDLYGINCVDGQSFSHVPLTASERAKHTLETGDLLYGESSLVREGIARTVYVTEKGAGTAFAWHTRRYNIDQSSLLSPFLYYYLQGQRARKHMMDQSIQTAITGINTTAYFECPILVPSLAEQTAIATILSDMDTEIAALEARRDKTRALKQGMMQELLTGRIRLV
jgi:type I restriction enzyme S subunit